MFRVKLTKTLPPWYHLFYLQHQYFVGGQKLRKCLKIFSRDAVRYECTRFQSCFQAIMEAESEYFECTPSYNLINLINKFSFLMFFMFGWCGSFFPPLMQAIKFKPKRLVREVKNSSESWRAEDLQRRSIPDTNVLTFNSLHSKEARLHPSHDSCVTLLEPHIVLLSLLPLSWVVKVPQSQLYI